MNLMTRRVLHGFPAATKSESFSRLNATARPMPRTYSLRCKSGPLLGRQARSGSCSATWPSAVHRSIDGGGTTCSLSRASGIRRQESSSHHEMWRWV